MTKWAFIVFVFIKWGGQILEPHSQSQKMKQRKPGADYKILTSTFLIRSPPVSPPYHQGHFLLCAESSLVQHERLRSSWKQALRPWTLPPQACPLASGRSVRPVVLNLWVVISLTNLYLQHEEWKGRWRTTVLGASGSKMHSASPSGGAAKMVLEKGFAPRGPRT